MSTIQMIDGRYYVTDNVPAEGASTAGATASVSFDDFFNSRTDELGLEGIFQKMADKYDVPLDLLKAVAKVESDFRMDVVSKSGAVGVMQLMPKTAEALGVTNIYDPEQNIEGGAKYLAGALDYFNGDVALAVAAYNAGYGAVERAGGIPPYEQTQNYVKKIYDVLSSGSETDVVGTVTVPKTNNLELTDTDNVLSDLSDTLKKMYSVVLGRNADGREMTLTEYISYENYMRLLDEFNEILQRVCFQDGDNDSENKLSSNSNDSDLSALYEATSSIYSARAQSLLKL